MAATQPLDSRILSQLIPREYNGKSAQEGRRFLAHTRLYLDQMDIAQIACHSRLDCATRQTGSKLTDGYQRRRRRSNKQ